MSKNRKRPAVQFGLIDDVQSKFLSLANDWDSMKNELNLKNQEAKASTCKAQNFEIQLNQANTFIATLQNQVRELAQKYENLVKENPKSYEQTPCSSKAYEAQLANRVVEKFKKENERLVQENNRLKEVLGKKDEEVKEKDTANENLQANFAKNIESMQIYYKQEISKLVDEKTKEALERNSNRNIEIGLRKQCANLEEEILKLKSQMTTEKELRTHIEARIDEQNNRLYTEQNLWKKKDEANAKKCDEKEKTVIKMLEKIEELRKETVPRSEILILEDKILNLKKKLDDEREKNNHYENVLKNLEEHRDALSRTINRLALNKSEYCKEIISKQKEKL